MKEIKVKPAPSTDNNGLASFAQKNLQATEEQIRYAKLSQMSNKDDSKLQEKMKEVSEITRKPPDVVSIALHDCSYDTNLAIQNIIEGYYDDCLEGEWKTTKQTKKGKKANISSENSINHTESNETTIDKLCNDFGPTDSEEQKPIVKPNRLSRGGGGGGGRGRLTSSENWHDDKSPPEERGFGDPPEKPFPKERGRSNDRGRGRGRGRGSMRGGMRGGIRGRGGFGRGGSSFRGSSRQNRGGFNRRGSGRDQNNRRQENDNNHTPAEESWDLDSPEKNDKVTDWADEVPNDTEQTDWSKDEPDWGKEDSDWVKENNSWTNKDEWGEQQSEPVENIFSRDVDWSQLNGQVQDPDTWNNNNNSTPPKDDRLKYLPENIDTAVIRSIPNSSTTGEVTAYQPTDDISRYINSPSNQFPSSHPEGGLTNTLNDRAFSLPSSVRVSDNIHRTISSMPIVSGVTESHKLEQEQLRTSKAAHHVHKPRRTNKYVNLPSEPVVMPRSAQMINDVEEQFTGLEFGSGPLSPRTTANENHSPLVEFSVSSCNEVKNNVLTENGSRHQVALANETLISHTSNVLPQSSIISVTSASKLETSNPTSQIISKSDVLKTPPGFKPLDQNTSHYLGSPGRGHSHLTPEPIPFPSSTNRTSPKTTINVFSRNGGLGTSVVVTEQQPSISTNYSDQKVYDQHENNINAEKIIAEQKALAEKQYRAEQQLLNEQNERTRAVVDQRSFNEEKPQVQNKLLNSQLPTKDQQITPEELTRTDRLAASDLPEQRKSISDTRVTLNDTHPSHRQNMSAKDALKLTKNDVANVSNKMHGPSSVTNQMSSIPKSTYSTSEILNLTSTTVVHTTTKTQGGGKTTSAPPGVLPMNLYAGVQPGMIPTAYQQQATLHGYSYDDLLQMQRVPMPPYTYDVSMFPAAAAGPTSAREGLQAYQGNESKFSRGADESSPVNIPQGTAHVAAGNMPTQQQAAYMNATGQLPYGYTYAYQPSVLPQGGVYPAFTTQSVYQMTQGKGTQYQTQFQSAQQQQGAYNSSKFTGTSAHDFSKGNFHHTNASGQVPLPGHSKGTQQNSSSSSSSTTIQSGPRTAYKSQYTHTQDGKGYPSNSPTSMTAQHGIHMHNQAAAAAAHIGNVNHYLVQPHTNLMTHSGTNLMTHSGQISASHISHQQMDVPSHRSQVHQMPFSGNQQKRDSKASYGSYWLGNR